MIWKKSLPKSLADLQEDRQVGWSWSWEKDSLSIGVVTEQILVSDDNVDQCEGGCLSWGRGGCGWIPGIQGPWP